MILLMMSVPFSFLLKLDSYHSHTFTSPLQQPMKQNHRALHNCHSLKNMLKLPGFKGLLNVLLLETESSEVMLKSLRSFLKFLFTMSLFKRFHL